MRAEQIQNQISLLEAEQRRLRAEGHRKIVAFAKAPDDPISDEAIEHFNQANALSGKIDALNQAFESAQIHDRADQKAAFLVETAAKTKTVIELADARVKVAAAVDKAFLDLRASFNALAEASAGIESQVRAIIATRDRGLDPLRRGEKISFALLHASGSSPAMMEALAQSVYRALPYLSGSGLIDFRSPVGDPARAGITMAAAADIAAHGLRQRLLSD